MRLLPHSLLAGLLVLAGATAGPAQAPAAPERARNLPPLGAPPVTPGAAAQPSTGEQLEHCLAAMEALRKEEATLQAAAQDDETKKKIDLLQKQIETLEKLVKLLGDQVKKLQATGAAVEKVEAQAATLEARGTQAARRDVELADAVDDLREHIDAQERYGPLLPAPLKELFLPSGTSETPLSIYGALAVGYSRIVGDSATAANGAGRPPTHGGFYFGEFTPDFLLKLNDWIFLEAEIGIGSDGSVSAGSFAQADFFINDWLTVIAGRFVAPIGWFNERLNNPWINKLPADAPGSGPLLWQQVLPAFSMLGVQAQGAFYLGCSPFKMEYNAYVSNGLNLTPASTDVNGIPTLTELANLEGMTSTFATISNDLAVGGRVGLWWPEAGLEVGVSGMVNNDYVAGGFEDSLSLLAVDFNYHKGDWDFRAEYGTAYQQAGSFGFRPIRRQGFYTQLAYRPREVPCKYLQNLELVYRYSYVTFPGIDVNELDLTAFGTPMDVPTRRQQNEFGVNYYFYPRLVLKVAYQINDEPRFHLHDNQFIAELAWGW
jgi:hypothetical protein